MIDMEAIEIMIAREYDKIPKVQDDAHKKEFERMKEQAKILTERERHKRATCGRRGTSKLSQEEIDKRIQVFNDSGRNLAVSARILGIDPNSFKRWVQNAYSRKLILQP